MENFLREAFQKLSLLENDFDFSSVDKDKIDELKSFVADDVEIIPEEPVIDVEAGDVGRHDVGGELRALEF